jgi:hypothetical protein
MSAATNIGRITKQDDRRGFGTVFLRFLSDLVSHAHGPNAIQKRDKFWRNLPLAPPERPPLRRDEDPEISRETGRFSPPQRQYRRREKPRR